MPLQQDLAVAETEARARTRPSVALVRGPIVSRLRSVNNEATPSIAFAYISAYIAARGYRPTVIDAIGEGLNRMWPLERYPDYQCQGLTFDEILARIPAGTEVIGVAAMFSGEWPVTRDLIKLIRARFPDALIVAGGEHITALTEYSLKDCPELDLCVRGEGEHTFFEVLEAHRAGIDFSAIAGIGYRDEAGAYRQNGALPRMRDLAALPWPHWPDGYMEKFWTAGKSYGVQSARDMPIMASRGCSARSPAS